MPNIVELTGVSKTYPLGNLEVRALDDVDLAIEKGEFTTIAGPSGSGKTTLLNLVGCIDTASKGTVLVDGQSTSTMSESKLTDLRLHKIGFIFQSFNLISVLNLHQNVEFPLLLQGGLSKSDRDQRVRSIVDKVGLTDYLKHRPNELSGGQRQRVAIARALVTEPAIVLADEPTANLDSATGKSIIDLMKDLNRVEQTTFIFSTHDPSVMAQATRVVRLVDGRIADDQKGAAHAQPEARP